VLPTFLEFSKDCVMVAHNAGFDMGFLRAACARSGYPELEHRVVDTARLARRILAGEVPNRKLSTLAEHFRCAHQPCHRAYDDALATTDVLHHLIERVTGFGVTTLEDLLAVSGARMDGTFKKIRLAEGIPKASGIYRFHGYDDKILYVGKATDLRARVRSYFHGDARRRMRDMMRETQRVSHETHASMLEAEIAEALEIVRHKPPYNRAGKARQEWYVKLPLRARVLRFVVTRVVKDDGSIYLGPMTSRSARSVVDAMRDAFPLNRCSRPDRCNNCAFAQMGVCESDDPEGHRGELRRVAGCIVADHGALLDAVSARMTRLARQDRYEEAGEVRDRGALLERAVWHDSVVRSFNDAGDVVIRLGTRMLLLREGRLLAAIEAGRAAGHSAVHHLRSLAEARDDRDVSTAEREAELRVLTRWLVSNPPDWELVAVSGTWCLPARAAGAPRFKVTADRRSGRISRPS
jgi:DNA polymerase-3 subunit epsilon